MSKSTDPIAVFDSGIGGISVLRHLLTLLPHENYIYLGDSANAPYGEKSTRQVRELTFARVEELLQMGADCFAESPQDIKSIINKEI